MRRSKPREPIKTEYKDEDTSASICRKKVFQDLRQRSVDKSAEFIQDLDLRAKHIASVHQKFRQIGAGGKKLTEEVALEILNRLAHGEQLSDICRDDHLPQFATVMKWIKTDPDFQEAYYEAKEFQMNVFADQILEIADNSTGDISMAFDRDGNLNPQVNYEHMRRSELRIKTRQWLMERYNKKQFSSREEKSEHHTAKSGNVQIQIMLPDNGRQIIDPITVDI
jgi:hypothetical protein